MALPTRLVGGLFRRAFSTYQSSIFTTFPGAFIWTKDGNRDPRYDQDFHRLGASLVESRVSDRWNNFYYHVHCTSEVADKIKQLDYVRQIDTYIGQAPAAGNETSFLFYP